MGLIRFLLAVAVIITHTGPAYGIRMFGGDVAVQTFFIISGFYMALILNEKYRGPGSYSIFIRARFLRLFPTYLVILLATLGLGVLLSALNMPGLGLTEWAQHGGNMTLGTKAVLVLTNLGLFGQDAMCYMALDPQTGGLYWTGALQSGIPAWHFMIIPPAWTLSVELSFYLLAPLLVRRRWWVIAIVAAASFTLRIVLMKQYHLDQDPWSYRFFPTVLYLFLMGVLAYKLYVRQRKVALLKNPCLVLPAWGAVLVLILLSRPYPMSYVFYLLFAMLTPTLFGFFKSNKFDRFVGELSYPIYVCHGMVITGLAALGIVYDQEAQGPAWAVLVITAVTVALSAAIHVFLERRVDAYRARVFDRGVGKKPLPVATPANP